MKRRGPAADDAAVIEGSWREPERFAVLFDRHAPHIHRYLARRTDRQVADDLVAETFLAAFAKRDRYDLSHPDARPWLYGIATNLVGQQRRDQARQYRISQAAAAGPEVPGHADRVAADVTAQAMRPLLDAALAALSAGEVSRALDIPVGTVQSRLHRARTKVRQALAGTEAGATYEELTTNE
jgi:RNA polymerase sigma factor (sigma-70 family)